MKKTAEHAEIAKKINIERKYSKGNVSANSAVFFALSAYCLTATARLTVGGLARRATARGLRRGSRL